MGLEANLKLMNIIKHLIWIYCRESLQWASQFSRGQNSIDFYLGQL